LTRFLYALGGFCVRRRVPVLVVWLLIVVALAVLARGVGEQTSDNLVLPGTDSQQATDTLGDHFPEQANGTNPIALAVPKGKKLSDAPYKDAIDGVVKDVPQRPRDPEGGRAAVERRRRADRQEQVDGLHLASG
jgi:RND superfamily putative drug exporter